MKTICLFLLVLAGLHGSPARAQAGDQEGIMGFSRPHAAVQRVLEHRFDTALHAPQMQAWMRRLSAHPHHVGSPYDAANARFLDSLLRSWGLETRIDTYYVLFPTPRLRKLSLVSPRKYEASLQEKVLPEDPYTAQTGEQLPPYNCYSADGDVTAELVFVNYGVPDDYRKLAEMGVDVRGKIVLAKYGGSWRGIKPKVARAHGALGCIIYSDPEDDGYYQGDVYPLGAYKNAYGVQRGSVSDMPVYPGDPLTPGYAATRDARRLPLKDAPTIMQIPVLPISYHDAQPLLEALGGPVAPAGWRGALPLTYHIGPGPATVHLTLAFDWTVRPIYNVMAVIRGQSYPDQWILRGNHHDAWVNGAADPVSGLVAALGEAQALGRLMKQGWRPRRTIVYGFWDGEEPGLLGSTEFVEGHAAELGAKAVAYINSDNNGRGFLYAGGSHSLEAFLGEIAMAVPDPETGVSIGQRLLDARSLHAGKTVDQIRIGALGSGSDYSPFLQHLGIASLNLGFGGEDGGGEYHTIYDTYTLFTRFKDPGLAYEVALAKVAGRAVLRLAEADVLPFEFRGFYRTVAGYAREVLQLAEDRRGMAAFRNKAGRDSLYRRAADPRRTFVAPPAEPEVPYFHFASLQNALRALDDSSAAYAGALRALWERGDTAAMAALNRQLFLGERHLSSAQGLPGRPWYRHMIYAPGLFTGYGVKTLPGIREAIEEGRYGEVDAQIARTAEALENFSAWLGGLLP